MELRHNTVQKCIKISYSTLQFVNEFSASRSYILNMFNIQITIHSSFKVLFSKFCKAKAIGTLKHIRVR